MKKRFTAVLVGLAVFASAAPTMAQNADETLKKIKALYSGAKTYQATILQTTSAGQMGSMTTRTDMKFAGKKMSATSTPVGQATGQLAMMASMSNTKVVSDGTNTWIYLPTMKRYTKMPSRAGAPGQADIRQVLEGLVSAKPGGTAVVAGKPTTVIIAAPKSPPQQLTEVSWRLFIDPATKYLAQIKMDGKAAGMGGAPQPISLTLLIQNQKFNQAIKDAEFKFSPPPGAQEGSLFGGPGGPGGPGGGARPPQ